MKPIITAEAREPKIYLIRGQKVMLDNDLAELYGVTTKRLNEQVLRTIARFPHDFMFQMKSDEYSHLRSHFATSSLKHGGRGYCPSVFTEHGALMAASVLTADRAVQVSLSVIRASINLREMIKNHKDLSKHPDEREHKYDSQFKVVFDAIRRLIAEPEQPKKKIGFIKEPRSEYRTAAASL